MTVRSVIHNTFVIEHGFPTPPERVFTAFSDPAKKRRWFAEVENHDVEEFVMEFRVGGAERVQSRFKAGSPFPGVALINEGTFQDIVPNARIVTASRMSLGGRPISVSLVTIELQPTDLGTTLLCTHQAAFFEGADGPQMREGGWRKLLDRLANELAGWSTRIKANVQTETKH
jgi:uncharacterized protein YndB with AHSA1/START domain